jgi:hypothetical protein
MGIRDPFVRVHRPQQRPAINVMITETRHPHSDRISATNPPRHHQLLDAIVAFDSTAERQNLSSLHHKNKLLLAATEGCV